MTLRQKLELDVEHRRKMRESCSQYDPLSVIAMTDTEANVFAARLAEGARQTIRMKVADGSVRGMDNDESVAYAAAIYSAISYLNCRDAEHRHILRYRDECRRQEAEQQKARADLRRHNLDFVIHIKT